jgi:NAD(P)-dependent dehydrogenase (short-subunit alcohol dehydrogenase family)
MAGTRLQDKVAIVTGAGSGIGRATAELCAEEGAKVVVAEIDSKTGQDAVRGIQAAGGTALFVQADISKEEDARRISEAAVQAFGRVDVLVNNAATFVLKGFDATPADLEKSFGVNLIGTIMVTKYAVERMKAAGGGAVVNLGSMSSFIAQPDFFAYSATKAAIVQLTRNMAMDLAPSKIRVNCVCPGTILTAASQHHIDQVGLTVEQFDAQEGAKTLLGRIGHPKEVAYAILFLASAEASFITGASLMVDGGYTAI